MKKLLLLLLIIPLHVKAISTSAESAILMDMDSKRILYAENIHEIRSVASISKTMTALIAIESGKINDTVTVGSEIEGSYGSGIYIKEGEILTLKDLLYGLMLRSGNDASYSIAKYVGGTVEQFVEQMNKKATDLGLKNTTFHNPNGLDDEEGNYSTAYDMAIIMSEAMKYNEFKEIVSTNKYSLTTNMNTYVWYNKNKLLKTYKYATGGKTGYTKIAKRTLINTASKDNLNLVVVTLNDGNDFTDHKNLFEYGFENYKNYRILKKGKISILEDDYYKNQEFYINNDFYYPLSSDEKDLIVIKFKIEKVRNIKDNIKIGVAQVYLADTLLHEEEVYIKTPATENFFQKLKNRIFKND
jgi:D-alanyl-D-alanine carboxypeptidase